MFRRILSLLIGFPLGIILVAIAVSNRQPVDLILDPFRPETPALSIQYLSDDSSCYRCRPRWVSHVDGPKPMAADGSFTRAAGGALASGSGSPRT